jgi:hypothetical protein
MWEKVEVEREESMELQGLQHIVSLQLESKRDTTERKVTHSLWRQEGREERQKGEGCPWERREAIDKHVCQKHRLDFALPFPTRPARHPGESPEEPLKAGGERSHREVRGVGEMGERRVPAM